ncbi:unnamed protein product [Caenorhabditis auriculariae]|uniref:Sema domain-containing protein n=1 Tax=Caenorhabditis auriculariae TaxID=2777116 RepID=A0A8S1GN65_9PELO|nr:unnamed protein product [Caenorhabditis auriculariae]
MYHVTSSLVLLTVLFGAGASLFEHHSNVTTFDFTNKLHQYAFDREDKVVILYNYGSAILLGGRNVAINVSLTSLKAVNRYSWKTSDSARRNCQLISSTSCDNFLRTFFELPNGQAFVLCGTHGLHPQCAEFVVGSSDPVRSISGAGLAPIDVDAVAPFLHVGDQLFTANVPELSSSEPLLMRRSVTNIARGVENDLILRTPRGQSAFEQAAFISMEKNGEEVLSFFSETPLDSDGCGLQRVARVGRVCRGDPGGKLSYSKEWTSFTKARLECAIEEVDQDTLHFNQLSSVSAARDFFYGAFRSQLAGIGASAVCRFERRHISMSLATAYKSTNRVLAESCPRASTLEEFSSLRLRPLIKQKISAKPSFVYYGKDRFIHILTQENVTATDKGNIFKVIMSNNSAIGPFSRHAVTMHVLPANTKVLSMMIHTEALPNQMKRQHLVVVTSQSVVKLRTAACSEADSCASCLAMGDPDCAWINEDGCVHVSENWSRKKHATQDSGVCPLSHHREPFRLAPNKAPDTAPMCLCKEAETIPSTTEVIHRDTVVREVSSAGDIWMGVAAFSSGLLVSAVFFICFDRTHAKCPTMLTLNTDAYENLSVSSKFEKSKRFCSGMMFGLIEVRKEVADAIAFADRRLFFDFSTSSPTVKSLRLDAFFHSDLLLTLA